MLTPRSVNLRRVLLRAVLVCAESDSAQCYTVSSAGFSIFVYWKFPVDGLHNLRPCTGFLFPVNSCIYYGLYTVLFFTYKWTLHFQWSFLCTGILQSIYRIFPVDGLRISGSFKSCILPEFRSPSTGKTAPEKNRPYTVWTATLLSICWNFPVNFPVNSAS